jgi:hypothetical protein
MKSDIEKSVNTKQDKMNAKYNHDEIEQTREYLRYITHTDIIELVNIINEYGKENNFNSIKQLLYRHIKQLFSNNDIQHPVLRQSVLSAFYFMLNNAETYIYRYGAQATIFYADGRPPRRTSRPPMIPVLNHVGKIAVDEWYDDYKNLYMPIIKEWYDAEHLNFIQILDDVENKKLVLDIIKYFEERAGRGFCKTSDFLLLFLNQETFVCENVDNPDFVVSTLKRLPLNAEQNHVLLGIILKWFGGYPVSNLNDDYYDTLKAIEYEFLSYEEQTPEKEFCRNSTKGSEEPFIKEREPQNGYSSFSEMFDAAVESGVIAQIENAIGKTVERGSNLIALKRIHGMRFSDWLRDVKNYEFDSEAQYKIHLTKDNFKEYLLYYRDEQLKVKQITTSNHEQESESWQLPSDTLTKTAKNTPLTTQSKNTHFIRAFTADEQRILYEGLANGNYLPKDTNYARFCYVFGGSPIPDEDMPFKLLQWVANLQDLHMLVNTLFGNEQAKWEKTVKCFSTKGNSINKNSIKNLLPKHKDNPPCETYFKSLLPQRKANSAYSAK